MLRFIALFIISTSLNAAEFIIHNPCSKTPLIQEDLNANQFETIGDLTIHLLNRNKIPFQGNERGINQILNSPLGLDALDVVSDTTMYAYGWCFRVNGIIYNEFAENIYIDESIKKVEWFFGYSKFYKDSWISMCIPPETRDNTFICKK